jgi:hypothetical protein
MCLYIVAALCELATYRHSLCVWVHCTAPDTMPAISVALLTHAYHVHVYAYTKLLLYEVLTCIAYT